MSKPNISEGLKLQQAGQFDAAKAHYVALLKSQPDNADAWHLLGMAMFSTGQTEESLNCLEQALKFVPNHPDVLSNLGLVHRAAGDLENARQSLQQATAISPSSAEIKNNLGAIYLEQGELDLAEEQFQLALRICPEFANAAMNLGNVWQKKGRLDDAEEIYRKTLKQAPEHTQILINLAEVLRSRSQWSEALKHLQLALGHLPDHREALICQSRCLTKLGRFEEAKVGLAGLLNRSPQDAKVHHYLGQVHLESGQMDQARQSLEKAVQLNPKDAFAWNSLGKTLVEAGCIEDAENCFRKVIELDPAQNESHSFLLFILSGKPSMDQQQLFEEHKRWGDLYCPVVNREHRNSPDPDRRIRIGYVSPDFKNHAVASFIVPVLKSHDRNEMEVFCYGEVDNEDDTTREVYQCVDQYQRTTGWSNQQLADRIESDSIDILVDLAGHTAGNRLLAFVLRPAPIQVTWIGYPNTTGMNCIDYRISCPIQNPANEPTFHTEKLIRMTDGSFCFSEPKSAPDPNVLPSLKNGFTTFGSLHRPSKITETVRDYWSDVLNRCPESRLIVFNTRFTNESSEELIGGLARRGIETSRIDVRNSANGSSYLETYHEVDIALDVTPWAGGMTTLEALWMGIPVVAYYGDRRSARSTAAIVNGIGCSEMIAYSVEEYVQKVSELAGDLDRLQLLRKELRQRTRETIVNAERFTRELENEYRKVWSAWCEQKNRAALEVT